MDTLRLRAPHLLFLPASSLFEGQVNQRATSHVVISQGVGILDEDALRGGEKEKKNHERAVRAQTSVLPSHRIPPRSQHVAVHSEQGMTEHCRL